MLIFKYILIATLLLNGLFALTLNELKSMPKSIERDFFIWRFISQKSTSKEEAIEAIKLKKTLNSKLKNAFYKKTGIRLTNKKRYKFNKEKLKKYQELIKNLHKTNNFFNSWLNLNSKERLIVFNLAGKLNRRVLDKKIPANKIIEMSKYYAFNEFIYRVEREKLNNIKESIFNANLNKKNKIRYKNLMKLAFLALKEDKEKKAYRFFQLAYFKAQDKFSQDKTLFWLYLTSKENRYLIKLSKSYDYNIYKLLALDFLNKPYPMPDKLPKFKKYNSNIDISDPIAWARLKKKIFSGKYNLYSLAKEFSSEKTVAFYRYILRKASRHKKQYFPIVYKEYLNKYSKDRQALILAIAKQESQFIPAAVSKSFAVGLMQFMPFLVKDVAKKKGLNIKLENMFQPKIAIEFANYHLNYLKKYLQNPFLIAYAYNGGIGFTRRLIRDKNYFQKNKYEPYLSMELVKNEEPKLYAKKVLANYVIYKMILGEPVRISTILNQLIYTKAHKF